MKTFFKIIAYFCIATTPIQVLVVLWGIQVVLSSDYGILSLSNIEFIKNYFTLILPLVEWFYSWFWNVWLDFIFSLPLILSQTFKAIVSTWLGFWILGKLKQLMKKTLLIFACFLLAFIVLVQSFQVKFDAPFSKIHLIWIFDA